MAENPHSQGAFQGTNYEDLLKELQSATAKASALPADDSTKNIEPLPVEEQAFVPEQPEDAFQEAKEFLSQESYTKRERDLAALYALPIEVSIALGKTDLQVSDILLIGQGSVIELDRLVGEDLDVYINGKALAKGSIVLNNDQFACRISHVLTRKERLEKIVMG